jgi:hypothetical protein
VNRSRLVRAGFAAAAIAVVALGCGEEPTACVDCNIPDPPLPFSVTDIYLRPLVIDVPPTAGRPVPSLAVYNLTAFYQGGTVSPTFDWTVPAEIGTVVPKTPQLGVHDATVLLQVRPDGAPPLGFFTITAAGQNASETGGVTRRFAVVRNSWMKHTRIGWSDPEPEDPISAPVFLPRAAAGDSIFFVQHQATTINRIKRIAAFSPLNGPEFASSDGSLLPFLPDGNNYLESPQLSPDLSPLSLARREMLFSSRMDSQYPERCPTGPAGCPNSAPLNLWVVRTATGIGTSFPRQVTRDSTYEEFGRTRWFAFDYEHPRWDPSASGDAARIAFISTVGGGRHLFTAILRDLDADGASDTLDTYRQLTTGANVVAYGWHPDGTRLCVSRGGRLEWVDAASGAVTPIAVPDLALGRFLSPSVLVPSGQSSALIAFQGQAENLTNIYVLDEAAQTLTRVLPYPVPVTHNMWPRWHPSRKAIVYVGDYTVALWANTTPPGMTVPDVLNPNGTELAGMPRTKFPSPWVVELE